MQYDVIVVGGSFAGLAAALYLGRARTSVCVIDTRQPRNRFARALYVAYAPAVMASISKASQTGCGGFPMAGCPHRHMTRRATPGIIPIDSSSLSSGTA